MPPAGRASRKDCAAAILFAAENATRAALNAIQLLGGNGCVLLLVMHMPRSEPFAHALGVRLACGALCSATRQQREKGSEQAALWLRLSPTATQMSTPPAASCGMPSCTRLELAPRVNSRGRWKEATAPALPLASSAGSLDAASGVERQHPRRSLTAPPADCARRDPSHPHRS